MSEVDRALLATERAQRAIAGEAEPPLPLLVSLGASMDVASGTVACATCGAEAVQLIEARTHPGISYPDHAAIGLECLVCGRPFAITFDREEHGVVMRSIRER